LQSFAIVVIPNTSALKSILKKDCVKSFETTSNTYSKTPQARDFYDENILTELETQTYRIILTHTNNEESSVNYYEFSDGIGYIPDVFVTEEYRRDNIGTALIQHSLDHFSVLSTDKVYIYPTNKVINGIITDELEFTQSDNIDNGYYVTNV